MRAEIVAFLTADTVLAGMLPGGIIDAGTVPGRAISRQHTPAAFDATMRELRPCALVRSGPALAVGLPGERTYRLDLSVILYAPDHLTSVPLESAWPRIVGLLRRRRVEPASGAAWEVQSDGIVLGGFDDTLQAHMVICRFRVMVEPAPLQFPPPAPPVGLVAAALGTSSLIVTWQPIAGASAYTLERSSDGGVSWQPASTSLATSWIETGLPAGATRHYRVAVTTPAGTSVFSAPVSATTPTPPPPLPPFRAAMLALGGWISYLPLDEASGTTFAAAAGLGGATLGGAGVAVGVTQGGRVAPQFATGVTGRIILGAAITAEIQPIALTVVQLVFPAGANMLQRSYSLRAGQFLDASIQRLSTGQVQANFTNQANVSAVAASVGALVPATWNLIVATFDGASPDPAQRRVSVSLNGATPVSTPLPEIVEGSPLWDAPLDVTRHLISGATATNTTQRFGGGIAHVGLRAGRLSPTQIAALWTALSS